MPAASRMERHPCGQRPSASTSHPSSHNAGVFSSPNRLARMMSSRLRPSCWRKSGIVISLATTVSRFIVSEAPFLARIIGAPEERKPQLPRARAALLGGPKSVAIRVANFGGTDTRQGRVSGSRGSMSAGRWKRLSVCPRMKGGKGADRKEREPTGTVQLRRDPQLIHEFLPTPPKPIQEARRLRFSPAGRIEDLGHVIVGHDPSAVWIA